ncbi:MAG: histidine kinase [Verrucomicrobiota bacterium]|nr:histidine kinase [Verrucomicrobiota bacterium]
MQALAQTRDGYLWIGTQHGLSRFDGIRFENFDDPTRSDLVDPSFMSLLEGRDGSFWLGTEDHGLWRWKNGKYFHYGREQGFTGPFARALCETHDGSLWIATTDGLTRYQDGRFVEYSPKQGLSSSVVRALCEDKEGNLWIGTDNGLNRFRDGVISSIPIHNGLMRQSIRALHEDRNGNLWIGLHGGLTRMKNGTFAHFSKPGGHSENVVSAIHEDRKGNLWVGTYGGLNRLVNGEFVAELNQEKSSYDWVYAITEDRESNIWIGTRGGLYRLSPRRFSPLTMREGLSHNSVSSICEDKAGSIWIGTWGGGLNRLQDGKITVYNSANGLGSDFVLGLGVDRDGGLWIGTPHDAYSLKRFKDGKFIRYGKKEGFIDVTVSVIHEDRQGNVWIGTRDALNCFKEGKFIRYTTRDGLLQNTVGVISEDHQGTLFFGTDAGLTRYKDGNFISGSVSPALNAIYEDDANNLWLASRYEGIVRPRPRGLMFYSTKEGLFSNNIYQILDDDFGFLWLSSRKGVFRVRKQDFDDFDNKKIPFVNSYSFGKVDGMPSGEGTAMAQPSALKSKDGRLWFLTTKGVAVIQPKTIESNKTPPPVVIEKVIADKSRVLGLESKVLSLERGNSARTTLDSRSKAQNFVLNPGRGELEVHYTALSFQAPEKNRFKYKLEGYDREWVDAETRRVAYYNNLSPGRYTFQVKACNNDGIWNDQEADLKIHLLPHFWQTWWFSSLCGIAVVGFIGGGARYFTKRKLQRKLVLLQQQHAIEKERTRIAQDMHDDLGANLTEILLLSDIAAKARGEETVKAQVAEISSTAREVVRNLDGIVWAVNPQNDSLEKLAGYIHEYVETYLRRSSIRCWMEMPEKLPEYSLSSEVRHNIFLTIKEALHNTVKHSGASEVKISLQVTDATLFISITDNGKGFTLEKVSSFGNGLQNMSKRIENIGGKFVLSAEPEKGTGLHLDIPLNR